MPKFKNFDTMEAYLQKNITQILARNANIERIIAEAISQSVIDVVYAAYSPEYYERRMDDDGLSDVRNVVMSDFGFKDGRIFVAFENIAQGNDSMKGQFISETIENGIESNWRKAGEWSEPRPFMKETAIRLNQNPTPLIEALKTALSAKGFVIR